VSALSDALTSANTAGLSARAVSRAARSLGHTVNHDTAARYLRGDHGTPDEATLIAFADVLGVPLRTLRAAANLPDESVEPYVPPAEASRLTRRQRRAVDEIIRAMLEPTSARTVKKDAAKQDADRTDADRDGSVRRLPDRPAATPEPRTATGTSVRKAARRGRAEPPAD
jgi:hypothetical protein